jgi:hypothetical protein
MVLTTKLWIIGPEIRASRPTTNGHFSFPIYFFNQVPYADANFTASTGVGYPLLYLPIVPRIPDIDFIKVILIILNFEV